MSSQARRGSDMCKCKCMVGDLGAGYARLRRTSSDDSFLFLGSQRSQLLRQYARQRPTIHRMYEGTHSTMRGKSDTSRFSDSVHTRVALIVLDSYTFIGEMRDIDTILDPPEHIRPGETGMRHQTERFFNVGQTRAWANDDTTNVSGYGERQPYTEVEETRESEKDCSHTAFILWLLQNSLPTTPILSFPLGIQGVGGVCYDPLQIAMAFSRAIATATENPKIFFVVLMPVKIPLTDNVVVATLLTLATLPNVSLIAPGLGIPPAEVRIPRYHSNDDSYEAGDSEDTFKAESIGMTLAAIELVEVLFKGDVFLNRHRWEFKQEGASELEMDTSIDGEDVRRPHTVTRKRFENIIGAIRLNHNHKDMDKLSLVSNGSVSEIVTPIMSSPVVLQLMRPFKEAWTNCADQQQGLLAYISKVSLYEESEDRTSLKMEHLARDKEFKRVREAQENLRKIKTEKARE